MIEPLDPHATATFRMSAGLVTAIDLHVEGAEYSVPLECAGGLRDVHPDTAELTGSVSDRAAGTFALMFDIGAERDRRFGKLPRVQLSFYRHRLTDMLVTTMTGEQSAFSSKLCASVPVGPVTCKDTRELQGLPPDVLVAQLRDLPAPIPASLRRNETERRRRSIYEELLDWGRDSIPPLMTALQDSDVGMRKNAGLALSVLSGGWWPFECGPAQLDISAAVPGLVTALNDSDSYVRARAAEALGSTGSSAAPQVIPALITLLERADESDTGSACAALGRIGPSAHAALPALRRALADANPRVRSAAARAIQRIEQQ